MQKTKTEEGSVIHTECAMTYDYQNNLFYSFKYNTPETKLEAFTLANFKKGGATSGFNKQYLNKRFSKFKSIVYGEEPQKDNKPAPHQLNLIQRIMKNVTTPVLINQSRADSKPLTSSNGEDLVKYQRVLVLQLIYKACQNFDLKLEEV